MDGSRLAVFSPCSRCPTVRSIRLLIVLKCCAASSRRTAENQPRVRRQPESCQFRAAPSPVTPPAPPLKHHLRTSDAPQKKKTLTHGSLAGQWEAHGAKTKCKLQFMRNCGVSASVWRISHQSASTTTNYDANKPKRIKEAAEKLQRGD